jgi:multicomponent Na+:H+ antiporter subunit B
MTRGGRLGLLAASLLGLAALLVWATVELPSFGTVTSAYAALARHVSVAERHSANTVVGVVFDVRALDTLVEEFILYTAATALALLLRSAREEEAEQAEDPGEGDALRLFGIAAVGAAIVLGLYVVAQGYLTPGGGFQGGVVLAAAAMFVFLGSRYEAFRAVTPERFVEGAESLGVLVWPGLGLGVLAGGSAFLANVLPRGTLGTLAAAGTIPLLNAATALAVAAAFTLIAVEFLEELMTERAEAERGGLDGDAERAEAQACRRRERET